MSEEKAEIPKSYPVGQAPWEQKAGAASATSPVPKSYPVGQAPWEQSKEGNSSIEAPKNDGGSFLDTNLSPVPGLTGEVSLRGIAKGTEENLPVIGAIGGGMLAGVPGAMIGGGGGQALKEAIEQGLQGVKRSPVETLGNIALQSALAGTGEAIAKPALELAKAAAPAIGSVLTSVPAPVIKAYMDGQMPISQLLAQAGGKIAVGAEAVQQKIMGAVDKAQSQMEAPALKIIGDRATQQSDAEVGATVKDMLTKDLQKRYGPFTEAYDKIDSVNQEINIPDEARRKLTQGMKDWALENHPESSDTYKIIQKHAQNIDASNTGAQLQGAAGDLKGDLTDAYKSGNGKRIEALTEMQGRVSDFQEKQITSLAKRVSDGTASEDEMASFRKIADSEGVPAEEDIGKYAKQISKDYLNSMDKVNSDYSGMKQYASAVQQQTGAKRSGGIGSLIKNIVAIPDEKLASKMFTPNNAAALNQLKTETPEIFNQLAGAHVRDLAAGATSGEGKLDTQSFLQSVSEMPKEVRNLVFSPEEQEAFSSVSSNPKLQALIEAKESASANILKNNGFEEHLLSAGRGKDNAASRDLGRLSNLTGQNLIREAQQLAAAKEISQASPASMLKRSAVGAAGGEAVGHPAGLPLLGPVMGAVGGAVSSPYALKAGLNTLNSAAAPMISSAVSQGAMQGAATLGQSVMHGSGAQDALRQAGPQQ